MASCGSVGDVRVICDRAQPHHDERAAAPRNALAAAPVEVLPQQPAILFVHADGSADGVDAATLVDQMSVEEGSRRAGRAVATVRVQRMRVAPEAILACRSTGNRAAISSTRV